MEATQQPAAPPARDALKDGPRLRKLTVTAAIDVWAETTLAIEGLTILRKEAAAVLLEHAERTGRRTYKDRIAVVDTGGSLVLDQPAVKDYLGAKLTRFMTRTKRGLGLKLLK